MFSFHLIYFLTHLQIINSDKMPSSQGQLLGRSLSNDTAAPRTVSHFLVRIANSHFCHCFCSLEVTSTSAIYLYLHCSSLLVSSCDLKKYPSTNCLNIRWELLKNHKYLCTLYYIQCRLRKHRNSAHAQFNL